VRGRYAGEIAKWHIAHAEIWRIAHTRPKDFSGDAIDIFGSGKRVNSIDLARTGVE
jgi:hypothetical protein